MDECKKCVQDTLNAFGGLDGIIANAGWTRFSDFGDLGSMEDHEWDKCWAAQVMGPKKYIQESWSTFQKNPEGGFMIITSSVAGQMLGGSSMPYSVTKAAQIHFMKCVAVTHGPTLRINAVLPGLLLTDWGNQFGEERLKKLKDAAALKQEVSTSSTAVNMNVNADCIPCRPISRTALTCMSLSLRIHRSRDRTSSLVSFPESLRMTNSLCSRVLPDSGLNVANM